jgi:hypothetical protein
MKKEENELMVIAKEYKGISYVKIDELPEAQLSLLKQTLNSNSYIKILNEEQAIIECLQYKDYARWYQSVFRPDGSAQN